MNNQRHRATVVQKGVGARTVSASSRTALRMAANIPPTDVFLSLDQDVKREYRLVVSDVDNHQAATIALAFRRAGLACEVVSNHDASNLRMEIVASAFGDRDEAKCKAEALSLLCDRDVILCRGGRETVVSATTKRAALNWSKITDDLNMAILLSPDQARDRLSKIQDNIHDSASYNPNDPNEFNIVNLLFDASDLIERGVDSPEFQQVWQGIQSSLQMLNSGSAYGSMKRSAVRKWAGSELIMAWNAPGFEGSRPVLEIWKMHGGESFRVESPSAFSSDYGIGILSEFPTQDEAVSWASDIANRYDLVQENIGSYGQQDDAARYMEQVDQYYARRKRSDWDDPGYEDDLMLADEPDEGDITFEGGAPVYQDGQIIIDEIDDDVFRVLKTNTEYNDLYEAIKAHMNADGYWPNVWNVSDHGNAHMVSLGRKRALMGPFWAVELQWVRADGSYSASSGKLVAQNTVQDALQKVMSMMNASLGTDMHWTPTEHNDTTWTGTYMGDTAILTASSHPYDTLEEAEAKNPGAIYSRRKTAGGLGLESWGGVDAGDPLNLTYEQGYGGPGIDIRSLFRLMGDPDRKAWAEANLVPKGWSFSGGGIYTKLYHYRDVDQAIAECEEIASEFGYRRIYPVSTDEELTAIRQGENPFGGIHSYARHQAGYEDSIIGEGTDGFRYFFGPDGDVYKAPVDAYLDQNTGYPVGVRFVSKPHDAAEFFLNQVGLSVKGDPFSGRITLYDIDDLTEDELNDPYGFERGARRTRAKLVFRARKWLPVTLKTSAFYVSEDKAEDGTQSEFGVTEASSPEEAKKINEEILRSRGLKSWFSSVYPTPYATNEEANVERDRLMQTHAFWGSKRSATVYLQDPNNSLLQHTVVVWPVLHVTDSNAGPQAIGRADWFSEAEARDYAKQQSLAYPEPNRFLVYDENNTMIAIYQGGEEKPLFEVVGEKRAYFDDGSESAKWWAVSCLNALTSGTHIEYGKAESEDAAKAAVVAAGEELSGDGRVYGPFSRIEEAEFWMAPRNSDAQYPVYGHSRRAEYTDGTDAGNPSSVRTIRLDQFTQMPFNAGSVEQMTSHASDRYDYYFQFTDGEIICVRVDGRTGVVSVPEYVSSMPAEGQTNNPSDLDANLQSYHLVMNTDWNSLPLEVKDAVRSGIAERENQTGLNLAAQRMRNSHRATMDIIPLLRKAFERFGIDFDSFSPQQDANGYVTFTVGDGQSQEVLKAIGDTGLDAERTTSSGEVRIVPFFNVPSEATSYGFDPDAMPVLAHRRATTYDGGARWQGPNPGGQIMLGVNGAAFALNISFSMDVDTEDNHREIEQILSKYFSLNPEFTPSDGTWPSKIRTHFYELDSARGAADEIAAILGYVKASDNIQEIPDIEDSPELSEEMLRMYSSCIRIQQFKGAPASWVQDEDIWDKAKDAAGSEGDNYSGDSYWAVVTHIYENMGGRVKGKEGRRTAYFDEDGNWTGPSIDLSQYSEGTNDFHVDFPREVFEWGNGGLADSGYRATMDLPNSRMWEKGDDNWTVSDTVAVHGTKENGMMNPSVYFTAPVTANVTQTWAKHLLRNARQMLMTQEILSMIPPLYAQDGKGMDAVAYVHFFNPGGAGDWWATEYDPGDRLFFGLADLGMGFPELGYFSLDELQSVTNRLGLGIERDLHWTPQPLNSIRTGRKARGASDDSTVDTDGSTYLTVTFRNESFTTDYKEFHDAIGINVSEETAKAAWQDFLNYHGADDAGSVSERFDAWMEERFPTFPELKAYGKRAYSADPEGGKWWGYKVSKPMYGGMTSDAVTFFIVQAPDRDSAEAIALRDMSNPHNPWSEIDNANPYGPYETREELLSVVNPMKVELDPSSYYPASKRSALSPNDVAQEVNEAVGRYNWLDAGRLIRETMALLEDSSNFGNLTLSAQNFVNTVRSQDGMSTLKYIYTPQEAADELNFYVGAGDWTAFQTVAGIVAPQASAVVPLLEGEAKTAFDSFV